MKRPDSFEFAMSFLGGKDADDMRRYVEELEKALREIANLSDLEMRDGDGARDIANNVLMDSVTK